MLDRYYGDAHMCINILYRLLLLDFTIYNVMTSEIHTITEAEFVRQVTPSILDLSDEVEDN